MPDALTRIHAALDRIEASLNRPKPATPPAPNVEEILAPLAARHEQLRANVAVAIAELDLLLQLKGAN
ncbi:hypothetical protein [Aquisediminimonas sediminicola]|uniref:hypothetical protein n=1 Tax=Alteraquisediminimonas sediminicola TaxID=2676787 RepID=UPI001C8F0384|nr:hypothetical protein [Aquisediminimonas sediminicola]